MMKITIKSNNHEHNDKPVPAGTVLEVDDIVGRICCESGVAEETATPAPAVKARFE